MTLPHLARNPVQEGNRSVFTWAAWMKRGKINAWQRIFTVCQATGDRFSNNNAAVQFPDNSYTNTFRFFDVMDHSDSHNTSNMDKYTEHRVTDMGGWYHFMAVVDTTAVTASSRLRLYINGHEVKDIRHTDNNPVQGTKSIFNARDNLHLIGVRKPGTTIDEGLNSEMFDNYFIDGQALDPSYFGYYRDGRGYTSQGTPRSNFGNYSMNNGAWHPLPPSAVKKKIESNGGFGTNGFYLPMNSVNHPGADFHIEPDTILKLKTNEQQPKAEIKGISEYRDDPYKDNLVLAVTGYQTIPDGDSPIVDVSHLIKGSGSAKTIGRVGGIRIRPMYNYYGSGIFFDGSDDELTFSGVPNPGTKDFTYEWWMNSYTFSGNYIGLLKLTSSTAAKRFEVAIHSNKLYFYTDTGNWRDTGFDIQYRTEQWYHIAFERHDGYINVYVNGDIIYSATNSRDYNEEFNTQGFGHHGSSYPHFNGKMYDLRLYDGVAKYRGPFDCVKPYSEQYFERLIYENNFQSNITGWSSDSGASLSHDSTNEEMRVTNGGGDNTYAAKFYNILDSGKKYRIVGRIKPALDANSYTFRVRAGGSGTQYSITSGLTNNHYANFDTDWITADGAHLEIGSLAGHMSEFRMVYVRIWSADSGWSNNSIVDDHQRTWRVTENNFTNCFARMNNHDQLNSSIKHNGLTTADNGSDGWSTVRATMGVQSGKWYWEIHHRVVSGRGNATPVAVTGIIGNSGTDTYNGARHGYLPGQTDDAGVTYYNNGNAGALYHAENQSGGNQSWADPYKSGDVTAVALDMDRGAVWFSKNGIWQDGGAPSSGGKAAYNRIKEFAREYFPAFATYYEASIATVNFGDNPTFCGSVSNEGTYSDDNGIGKFKYQPPDGFLALCTKNLPDPIKSEEYFRAISYRGWGGQASLNTGIDADLAWIKRRDGTTDWYVADTVRGNARQLIFNKTDQESLNTSNNGVYIGNKRLDVGNLGDTNTSGGEYVTYLWKAGGSKGKYNYEGQGFNTAAEMLAVTGVDVTNGDITPTGCSISRKAGLGIYTYTGTSGVQTVANGLDIGAFHPNEGGKGLCIMTKRRDAARSFHIAFGDIGGSGAGTAGSSSNLSYINFDNQTGNFDTGNNGRANITPDGRFFHSDNPSQDFVAYIWKEVEGFSRIGVYVGNNSTSNSFIYCGFRPAFVMWRKIASGENWRIIDSARSPGNTKTYQLFPGKENAESDEGGMEFYYNGFAPRTNDANTNGNVIDYVFMAFAESPMKYATAGH